jgi:hypothetical protein
MEIGIFILIILVKKSYNIKIILPEMLKKWLKCEKQIIKYFLNFSRKFNFLIFNFKFFFFFFLRVFFLLSINQI